MAENVFASYLEDRPEAGYFSYQDQWRTPNQKKWFQSQFSNIQNQYLGQLGQWVRQGSQGQPQQFSQFLANFPWEGQFREQGTRQDSSRYNPWTRWII